MQQQGAPLVDRVRQLLLTHRVAAAVGVAVVVVAVIGGVIIGSPPIFGGLGVVIALAGFAMLVWRNRRRGGREGASIGVVLAHFALATVVVFGIIQLVPYGRSHSNPPITGEPAWASPQTRELMVGACYGCHSNEVEWPWYSNIAPISWVVTAHVDEGREKVNYSEFSTSGDDAEETIEVILEGSMPPSYYTLFGLHPEAKLSDAEIDELVAGLRLTPGMDEDGERGGGDDHDDEDDDDDD
jgi:hypothetical protein